MCNHSNKNELMLAARHHVSIFRQSPGVTILVSFTSVVASQLDTVQHSGESVS